MQPVEATNTTPHVFTWKSKDGLTLSGCEWKPLRTIQSAAPAILCLPGLSRNTRDFNDIAEFLRNRGHHVIALDYRGRGKSDWDDNWQNYTIPVEGQDIDDALAKLNVTRFTVLGTSRGGLHAMAMAHRFGPDQLVGVVLNDIGPHIEMNALQRLSGTIGKTMEFIDTHALATDLNRTLGPQFPAFDTDDWLKMADQLSSPRNGKCCLDYDPALGNTLADLDENPPWPDLWPVFEPLKSVPLLVIRGEYSDLLSEETCTKMMAEHPGAKTVTVSGQGHAPLLWDSPTQSAIGAFFHELPSGGS